MIGRMLITGGTGTLGRAVVKYCLDHYPKLKLIVYSRDEFKQWTMRTDFPDSRLTFILGDVRDRNRVFEAVEAVDYVIHAAAYKHVASAENNPYEVIQTNIIGTKNVIDACYASFSKLVLVSSDKAVQPTNLYGATKMAAETMTIQAKQNVVRYGNVFGSRGSVLHIFKAWAEVGHTFKITDKRMTRFVLTVEDAVKLVLQTLTMAPGSLNVPFLPAMRIVDLARAFDENCLIEEIGIQPGEKLHESLSENQSSDNARMLTIPEIKELINATI